MKKVLLLLLLTYWIVSAFTAVTDDTPAIPAGWPSPCFDFKKQPLTAEKIRLGRQLFYDPILSHDSTVSCAGCHSPYNAFAHTDHALSHGIGDSIGRRNAPALMNLAWQRHFMWDGAFTSLDSQILFPILHPGEMGEDTARIHEKLAGRTDYRNLYLLAYGDSVITTARTLEALRQFLLTLISSNARYDSVMRGETVFTRQESNGHSLFKTHCSSCHKEPLFSHYGFENNGLPPDTFLNDRGRAEVTGKSSDMGFFKVPSLRNIAYTYPYMHDGRFKHLRQVLDHYSEEIEQHSASSKGLKKNIPLTTNEKTDLIAFLLTLSDRHFLFHPANGDPRRMYRQEIKP